MANAWPVLPSSDPYLGADDLVALHGDVDWTTVLVDGSAPEPGQIAVNSQWAKDNGIALGDVVTLVVGANGVDATPTPTAVTLRVSGITRSPVGTAAVQLYLPGGFVAWDDVPELNQAWAEGSNESSSNVGVTVSGNGAWPWNEELAFNAGPTGGNSWNPALSIAIVALMAFGALLVGLVAMAFALGRAQAQSRVEWIGTVRALGATKRQIASASLLESAAVGVTAGIVGYLIGAFGAFAHLRLIAARVARPMIFAAPAGYLAIALGAVLLAVVLALIVGAVPAFWSARISPTAALKPVTDLSEATVSRNVKVWPLTVSWLLAVGVVVFGASGGLFGRLAVVLVCATVVIVVTSIMLAHEVLRHSLPWNARLMSQSPRRMVMVAGDAILARPRQSTIPAFIVALSTAITLSLFAQVAASWATEMAQQEYAVGPDAVAANPYVAPLPLLGVYAVVTLLCVAIALATGSVSAREAATREALGLTAAQGRRAAGLQYLVAQGHGLLFGLVGGAAGGMVMIAMNMTDWRDHISSWAMPVAAVFVLAAVIACACATFGAVCAAVLAPRTAPLSRVEVSA